MSVTIKLRRGLASEWVANSSVVLASGEPGFEIDTGRLKIGNGVSSWSSLNYSSIIPTGLLAGSGIDISLGPNGSTALVSIIPHTHTSSNISDFDSRVNALLPTIANSGDNRILTSTGSTNGINAESSVTFDGTNFNVNGIINIDNLRLDGNTISATNNNGNIVIQSTGTGSLQRDSNGDTRGQYAVDWQNARASGTMVAGGNYSVIGGGKNNTAGLSCVVAGGSNNNAAGDYNTIGGGKFNTASGYRSTIAGGESNNAEADCCILGGYRNSATGYGSTIGGGMFHTTKGQFSVIVGGNTNIASGNYSAILGGQQNKDNNFNNVFILGSNITATQADTTYTQNLISQSGRFTSLNVNGTGISLSGHTHKTLNILIGDTGESLASLDPFFSGVAYGGSITDGINAAGGIDVSVVNNFNSSVSGLVNGIYAPLNSPALTGVPLAPTASSGTNTNQIASTAFVRTEISNLVGSAPSTLDTLNELATALGNDANFSTTITNSLSTKVSGTGTTNYVPKFTSSKTIENSTIFNSDNNVGIGTITPQYTLDVAGTGNFTHIKALGVALEESLYDEVTPGSIDTHQLILRGHTAIGPSDGPPGSIRFEATAGTSIGIILKPVDFPTITSNSVFVFPDTSGGTLSVEGHYHSSSDITNFSSSVSGLLPTIANSGDNRILTSSGSSVGINAESNATFDGTTLAISGAITVDNLKLDGNTLSSTNSNGNIIIQPSGSGALQSDSSGDVRGQYAVDLQRVRNSNASVASGHYSVIGGGRFNAASGEYSTVSGGSGNRASEGCTVGGGVSNHAIGSGCTVGGGTGNSTDGSSTTVCGGSSNEATAVISTVCGGYYNKASNYGCSVGGGDGNNATGQLSTVAGGGGNTASGQYSSVGGGSQNIASGYGSTVVGGIRGKATRYGEISHAAGNFVNAGDAQHTVLIARRLTTDNTANQVLFLDGSSDTNYKLTIPPKTTWTFEIKLSAYNNNDDTVAGWIYRGVIRRNGTDSTVMVGSLIEESWKEEPMDNTSANVIANDTNDTLEIRVTGLTGKNIRWVAVVDISQVSCGVP